MLDCVAGWVQHVGVQCPICHVFLLCMHNQPLLGTVVQPCRAGRQQTICRGVTSDVGQTGHLLHHLFRMSSWHLCTLTSLHIPHTMSSTHAFMCGLYTPMACC